MPEQPKISLFKGTSIVSSLTIVSRIFGFLRDLFIAGLFGASLFADAFFVAFRIPNLLRSLAAEGALTSAFVPVFSTELEKSHKDARNTLAATSSLIMQVVSAIAVLGIIFAPDIVSLIAPGFTKNPEQFELTILLTRIMLPYILFVSLVSMINGALNSVGIFGSSAIAQIVVNIALIIGAFIAGFYEKNTAVVILSTAVPIGGLFAIIVQTPFLRKASLLVFPGAKALTKATKEILKLMLPAILGAAVYQLGVFLNTALASVLKVGSISWLFYSDRIIQLPIGVFTVALASVLLPTLSRAQAKNNKEEFLSSMQDSLRFTSFVIIPIAFGLYCLADPIVRIVFERGQFTAVDSAMTAISIKAFCFGLWSVSSHSMLVRAFLARKDTITPMIIGAISLCIGFCISVLLMGEPIRSEGWIVSLVNSIQSIFPAYVQDLKHVGLALGSTFYSFTALILSAGVLLARVEGFRLKSFIFTSIRSSIAGLAMYFSLIYLFDISTLSILELILALITGALTYSLASFILGSSELRETYSHFSRLLSR